MLMLGLFELWDARGVSLKSTGENNIQWKCAYTGFIRMHEQPCFQQKDLYTLSSRWSYDVVIAGLLYLDALRLRSIRSASAHLDGFAVRWQHGCPPVWRPPQTRAMSCHSEKPLSHWYQVARQSNHQWSCSPHLTKQSWKKEVQPFLNLYFKTDKGKKCSKNHEKHQLSHFQGMGCVLVEQDFKVLCPLHP